MAIQFPEPLGVGVTGMLPPTSTIWPPLPLVIGAGVVLFCGGDGAGAGGAVVEPEPLVFWRVELSEKAKPPPCGDDMPAPPWFPVEGLEGADCAPPPAHPADRMNAARANAMIAFMGIQFPSEVN